MESSHHRTTSEVLYSLKNTQCAPFKSHAHYQSYSITILRSSKANHLQVEMAVIIHSSLQPWRNAKHKILDYTPIYHLLLSSPFWNFFPKCKREEKTKQNKTQETKIKTCSFSWLSYFYWIVPSFLAVWELLSFLLSSCFQLLPISPLTCWLLSSSKNVPYPVQLSHLD